MKFMYLLYIYWPYNDPSSLSLAFHHRGWGLIPNQSTWDLW